jgi:hypothetical protein
LKQGVGKVEDFLSWKEDLAVEGVSHTKLRKMMKADLFKNIVNKMECAQKIYVKEGTENR